MLDLPALRGGQSFVSQFAPPPRFAGKRLSAYRPDPAYPSQAAALQQVCTFAGKVASEPGLAERLRARLQGPARGVGLYLDGGFGVGKTHLLAGLWNAAPSPKAYLSFDELMYAIGLRGVAQTRRDFAPMRLVAVDEWELDDPGNLQLALAFLRGVVEDGVAVAVTSNTVPAELGRGRFSQKDFKLEIEELASGFRVVRIEGDDFRQRRFQAEPGRDYFVSEAELMAAPLAGNGLRVGFAGLQAALRELHPIRYAEFIAQFAELQTYGVQPVTSLEDALRWVHFVDKLYEAMVPFAAAAPIALGDLFPGDARHGPFAKKMGRCLSRMEEMLLESAGNAGRAHPAQRLSF